MSVKETIEKMLLGLSEQLDNQGHKDEIQKVINELNGVSLVPVHVPGPEPKPEPTPVPVTVPVHAVSDGSENFLDSAHLYVNPNSVVAKFVAANPGDTNVSMLNKIAVEPTAIWLTGGTQDEVYKQVQDILKAAGSALVTFIVYNIPHRDNGGASAGGAADQAAYESWIGAIDAAVKDLGNPKVVFIMEPDALGFASQKADYAQYATIKIAIDILTQNPNRSVYLDIPMWNPTPDSMASAITFLKTQDGMKNVRGWALNTSGYNNDEACQRFGESLVGIVGCHYIVDTSRNANGGVPGQWENVPGQELGAKPLSQPATATFDGNIWAKPPGESDGNNSGHPNAGEFDYAYAVELAKNSK